MTSASKRRAGLQFILQTSAFIFVFMAVAALHSVAGQSRVKTRARGSICGNPLLRARQV